MLQVVLSYLEDQPPDTESTQAAFEAYFAQPLQIASCREPLQESYNLHCREPLNSFQPQILQLKEAICQALVALHAGDSTVVESVRHQYPAVQALEALQDAVSIISTRLKHSSDSADMLQTYATAAASGTFI